MRDNLIILTLILFGSNAFAEQFMCSVDKSTNDRVYEQVVFNTDNNKLILIDPHWGTEEHVLEKHDYYPKSDIWIKKSQNGSTGSIELRKLLLMDLAGGVEAIYSVVALTPDQKTTAWIQKGDYKCAVKK